MNQLITIIKDNIYWVKDAFTIIFTGVATVIGILTYKRAKATLLQPIRSEVIKKQSQILTELFDYISKEKGSFEGGIDYVTIASTNAIMLLKDYGFIFDNDSKMMELATENISGWIYCGESKIVRDVKVVGVFNTEEEGNETQDVGKDRYYEAKNGIYKVEKIYLTKNYDEFMQRFRYFYESPFIPKNIKNILDKLIKDINYNLNIILKEVLTEFLGEFCKRYFDGQNNQKISFLGVYNEFNHKKLIHKSTIINLHNEIRSYLMIDEKW